VLLLFEDIHWADATSLEVLNLLVERVRRLPVLALLTYRPEFEPPWAGLANASTLALGRLGRRQARAMIDWVAAGKALPYEVVEQILAKTDGVPLFVEELTKTVLESGLLAEEAARYRLDGPLPALAIPATLQDSLMARLDRLSPVKEIAQIGAAIGREFSYALLQAVAGRDAALLDAALAQLEDAELVFRSGVPPDVRYRFKHALVQDAAHESLLKSRRQVLHRNIAEALIERFAAEAQPEVIASHFAQASLAVPAVEWWVKAGEQASSRSAHVEAVAHYEQAIALADTLPDEPGHRLRRLRLQTAYGQTLIAARGHAAPQTTAAFTRAWELAAQIDDPAERAAIYYGLWSGNHIRSEVTAMQAVADAFLRDAERRPGSLEAVMAHRAVGANAWSIGDFAGARPHYEQALAVCDPDRHQASTPQLALDPGIAVMMQFPAVLWGLGEIDRACALAEEGFRRSTASAHLPTVAYGHMYSCVLAILRRDAGLALPFAEALVDLSRKHGPPNWLAMGTCFLGWARSLVGDPDVATAELHQALAFFREQGHRWYLTVCPVLVAETEARAGDAAGALATLDAALALTEQTGQRWFQSELHRQQGEIVWRHRPDDIAGAMRAFGQALAVARVQRAKGLELRAALSLTRLYAATGRHDAAATLLAPLLAALGGQRLMPELGEAEQLLAAPEARRQA
jgi:predicted ATPase